MEKKSLVKKLTGSREALLAVVLIVLFIVITAIIRLPDSEIPDGYAEKQCGNNGDGSGYAVRYAGRRN